MGLPPFFLKIFFYFMCSFSQLTVLTAATEDVPPLSRDSSAGGTGLKYIRLFHQDIVVILSFLLLEINKISARYYRPGKLQLLFSKASTSIP